MLSKEILEERNIIFYNQTDWVTEYYNKMATITNTTPDRLRYNHYVIDRELEKLKDVDKAAELLKSILDTNGRVLLVTDYDCDGISSAITLDRFFRTILKYTNYKTIVNQRKCGNGMNKDLLREVLDEHNTNPVALVITADHMSSNELEISTMKTRGIQTILTDHHEIPEDNYPNSAAVVVNVMRKDSEYNKSTSGCHVAFLVCVATYKLLYPNKPLSDLYPLLPFVGVSTIVDQMDMSVPHNRDTAKTGINVINSQYDINYRVFKNIVDSPFCIKSKNVSWTIGPFFNSGNRCNTEHVVFRAFSSPDQNESTRAMQYANYANNDKKKKQRELFNTAQLDLLKEYPNPLDHYGLALVVETEYGITGPIANRIGEVYNRPAVVFRTARDNTVLAGSARAILDIDLLGIFKQIAVDRPDVVIKAAGHKGACGIDIYSNQLENFRQLFSDYVYKAIDGKVPKKTLEVVSYIPPEDITLSLALQVESVGPYGQKWDEPLFMTKAKFKDSFVVGINRSATFYRVGKTTFSGLYTFDRDNGITQENWLSKMVPNQEYYLVFSLQLGYYRKRYTLDIVIKDIIPIQG